MTGSLVLQIPIYSFTLWLALYLIARDRSRPVLVFTGLGLLSFALGLALDALNPYISNPVLIESLHWPLRFAPALFWYGASAYILPEQQREMVSRYVGRGSVVALVVLYILSLIFNLQKGSFVYGVLAVLVILRLLLALGFVWRSRRLQPKRPLGILLVVTLFFTVSAALFILPIEIFPPDWVLLALDLDMLALAGCIAFLDAFDEGETLLPDLAHSFTISFLAIVVFGGQILWAMSWNQSVTFPMVALLFASITAAIAIQVFSQTIQGAVDRLVFARFARLRRARADLRNVENALPRLNEALDLAAVDEETFVRLTRRALSNLVNPGKLAASPLTRLPIVETRLSARGESANTLERTAELKALLTESITRLKPRDKGDFGTSEEWHFYNALYFPYVLGLKPYNLNGLDDLLDKNTHAIMDWFRAAVPERTLHNWQNAAARLIAQDLREREEQIRRSSKNP